MNWQHAKALREERGKAVAAMQAMLSKCNDEKRDLSGEETESFDKLHKRAEDIKGQLDRYDVATKLAGETTKTETRQAPGRDDVNTPEAHAEQQAKEQRAQVDNYLRSGVIAPTETRALTTSGAGI